MKLRSLFLILLIPIVSATANDARHTAEYKRITSGCWTLDVWNTPSLGHRGFENGAGDMRYFDCDEDSTFHPLFNSSLIVGWINGVDTVCYSDMMGPEYDAGFIPLDSLTITMIYNADSQESFYEIKSPWCTPDSVLSGEILYCIPVDPDTSVILQRVNVTNNSIFDLENFIIGVGFDWNVNREAALDDYGFVPLEYLTYQEYADEYHDILAGVSLIAGTTEYAGACILPNSEYIDPHSGYDPMQIYGLMKGLDYQFISLADREVNLNTILRFWKGTLPAGNMESFCYADCVSFWGNSGLMNMLDKAIAFSEQHEICLKPNMGWGWCGDANYDSKTNVSDVVWIINYVFAGGPPPYPNIACADVNEDHTVNVSDAVYIINFIFVNGPPPDYCAPDFWPVPCWPYGSK